MMRNYAQIIKEAAYSGYDPKYNVDYEDDAYMAELDDEVREDKIYQMRESAKSVIVMLICENLKRQGYIKVSEDVKPWKFTCIMKKEDGQKKLKVEFEQWGFSDFDICVTIRDSGGEWVERWTDVIKISTKNSKAKPVFRMPWDRYRRRNEQEHWLRVVCDSETGKAIEVTEYTDPYHQLKKGELDAVRYEPGYEPEQETARLPDLFYEVMEKKEMQNHLASLDTVTIKGKVTSVGGYLLITFFQEINSDYWSRLLEHRIPDRVSVKCTEDVPVMQGKVVQVVLMECFHLADGAVLWLQIPEIRTEKNGAALMPAGGFVYV